ncbi:MAG: DUF2079 domain-containing protein [Acidimicrobiales bacterium]
MTVDTAGVGNRPPHFTRRPGKASSLSDAVPGGDVDGDRPTETSSAGDTVRVDRRRERILHHRWSMLRGAGAIVIGLWFVGLVTFSTILYGRNFVGQDFGTYNQAWSLIGQGHLNPFVTVYGPYTFLKSDFELIIWPLALLHLVFPSSLTLLWIQDIAVAGTGLVTYLWIVDYLQRKKLRWTVGVGVAIVILAVIVVNPEAYRTLLFDFHMEPLSAFFLVLAGRDLWRGRGRRAWIWIGLTLLCGSFATVTLIGLGLSAVLVGRDSRRQGVQIIVVALAWSVLISLIGANAGSGIDVSYSYLAGRNTLHGASGLVVLVVGMVTHPSRVIDQLHHRLGAIYTLMKPVGVIGLASAWGFGVPFVVLTCNALSAQYGFIFEPFQSAAAYPFLLFGTVTVLVWLAQRFKYGWAPGLLVGLLLTVQALTYGITTSPGSVRWAIDQVTPGASSQLDRALALTPARAEVFAAHGIMGRFSARPSVYFLKSGHTYPVSEREVVFVIDPAHDRASLADNNAYISFVRDQLHARMLTSGDGVWAFEWRPPKGTTRLTLPPPIGSEA